MNHRINRRLLGLFVTGAAALTLASCSTGSGNPTGTASGSSTPVSTPVTSVTPTSTAAPTSSAPPVATKPVKVTSLEADGVTVGVGMPVILRFTPSPTDSTAFTKAATVTVNGEPANGAWYWEQPLKGSPIEAHYRPKNYWPANATIQVKLPIEGLSAGKGLAYEGKLTSVTFQTGDAHVSTVDASSLTMTVTNNGKVVRTMPVSLGKATTPTYNGTKVVMQKGENMPGSDKLRPNGTVMMSGPGYTNDPVQWSVRVTTSGEYVHSAPWNGEVGARSTSNGCTNLRPADGKWFYDFSNVGDVVKYINTGTAKVPTWDGYADWNINWATWSQGGLLLNH